MDKTLRYRDVDMFYTVEGTGSPVILMHGWGCTHATVKTIEDVCIEKHRVYNVDFPGFGSSSEPSDTEQIWGVEDYTQIIEELVRKESIENPILIGHSFGGRVAIVFSSRNKVEKMVLVDAAGLKPKRTLKYYFKVYGFKFIKNLTFLIYGKEKGQRKVDKMRSRKGSADYKNSSPMMRRIMSKVVNEDLRHLLCLINAPTLLIWGENDTATPVKDAKVMEKLIEDAGLVVFPGAGHYSFLDNRFGFASVLRNFINS